MNTTKYMDRTATQAKKILIVEDERTSLKALVEFLEGEGVFSLLVAKDGQEALEKALKEHPDLILLDIILPSMDGLTVLRELRKDAWGKNASVIILTNLKNLETILAARENGVSRYLVKTEWSLDGILKEIKEELKIV